MGWGTARRLSGKQARLVALLQLLYKKEHTHSNAISGRIVTFYSHFVHSYGSSMSISSQPLLSHFSLSCVTPFHNFTPELALFCATLSLSQWKRNLCQFIAAIEANAGIFRDLACNKILTRGARCRNYKRVSRSIL